MSMIGPLALAAVTLLTPRGQLPKARGTFPESPVSTVPVVESAASVSRGPDVAEASRAVRTLLRNEKDYHAQFAAMEYAKGGGNHWVDRNTQKPCWKVEQ